MNEGPRRRRPVYSEPPRPNGGEFPLIPAIIVVILVGLFVGAVFAHYVAAPKHTKNTLVTVRPTALPTAAPTLAAEPTQPPPTPAPKPTAAETSSPSPQPTATHAVTPPPRPQNTALALATASPVTPKPATAKPSTPRPAPSATPVLKHTLPVARATENTSGAAAGVVRSYIGALASGRPQAAAAYLANGSPDQDSFVDAGSRIGSISSSRNTNGTYHVDANVVTASGTYAMSFTVSATNRITDHVGVKIH